MKLYDQRRKKSGKRSVFSRQSEIAFRSTTRLVTGMKKDEDEKDDGCNMMPPKSTKSVSFAGAFPENMESGRTCETTEHDVTESSQACSPDNGGVAITEIQSVFDEFIEFYRQKKMN